MGSVKVLVAAIVVLGGALLASSAFADDWLARQLIGRVQQQVGGKWIAVARGDAVADGHLVRTLGGARVTLVRGTETIEVGPGTQLVIEDRSGGKPFTTVTQMSGTVSVEADIRNVQHFAVETPYLAAVVKGTRFTVDVSKGKSSVAVKRGHVEVESHLDHSATLLSVGQEAQVTADTGGTVVVSGDGKLPVVYGANGKALGVTAKGAEGNAYGIAKQDATSGNGVSGADNGQGGGNGKGGKKS